MTGGRCSGRTSGAGIPSDSWSIWKATLYTCPVPDPAHLRETEGSAPRVRSLQTGPRWASTTAQTERWCFGAADSARDTCHEPRASLRTHATRLRSEESNPRSRWGVTVERRRFWELWWKFCGFGGKHVGWRRCITDARIAENQLHDVKTLVRRCEDARVFKSSSAHPEISLEKQCILLDHMI